MTIISKTQSFFKQKVLLQAKHNDSSHLVFDALNEEHGSHKQLLPTPQLVNP